MHGSFARFLTAIALVATCGVAQAQTDRWPSRPITLVVPYAAGGSTDAVARMMAAEMSRSLNANVVVDNKAGAGGTIGSTVVARARPDGYTLMLGSSGDQISAEFLFQNLKYSATKDLVPVALVAREYMMMASTTKLPVRTTDELIAQAKARPLTVATAGKGSNGHLGTVLLNQILGSSMEAVPYRGTGPAVMDAAAGQTDLILSSPVAVLPHVKSGALKPIAVAAEARQTMLPDVPTFKELGIDFVVPTLYPMVAPAGTPTEIIRSVNEAVRAALQKPEIIERIRMLGAEPYYTTPEGLGDILTKARKEQQALIKSANIVLE